MRITLLVAGFAALAACGNGGQDSPEPETAPPAETTAPETVEATPEEASVPADPLDAGQYCYFRDDENVTEGLDITVGDNGIISGNNYGHIHQEAAGYYASFETELSNGVQSSGADVTFEYLTEVDGDTQSGSMLWAITPERAAPDGLQTYLASTSCDGLMERVFPVVDEE